LPVCKWCHKETAPWNMTPHGICKDCYETVKGIVQELLPPPQIEKPVKVPEEEISEEAVEEATKESPEEE